MPAESDIDALFLAWTAAVLSKDIARVVSLVTEDCEFWTNAAPPLKGREAVRSTLQAFYATFDHRQEFDRHELLVAGDLAFARGIEHNFLTPLSGGPEIYRSQRAFMVIRREPDGRWRFARGMTNLLPPESPANNEDVPA
jgi:uncharacterized protein (TIGR02246 family)